MSLKLIRRAVPVLALGLLSLSSAWAASVKVNLVRASLDNVSDTAGITQHEGGVIQSSTGAEIGHYIVVRRVTTSGTSAYNTAAETITLFFAPATTKEAPDSVTVQGAHVYSSGNFEGSVSAASYKHHSLIGASASAVIPSSGLTVLTFSWLGGDAIRLP